MKLENDIQQEFIRELVSQGYEELPSHLTVEQLDDNLRIQLERLNADKLPQGFSDESFSRLLRVLNTLDMSEAFQALRHGIEFAGDAHQTIHLNLFDTHGLARNHFQVAQELVVKSDRFNRRLDVVVLMNGIPVFAAELKRAGSHNGLKRAISDLNTYSKEGVYRTGLLRFTQLYVGSDGTTTKYFGTSLAAEKGDPTAYKGGFNWSDEKNNRIHRLISTHEQCFANTFMAPEMLTHLLRDCMLLLSGSEPRMIVLRPYQIYAVREGHQRLFRTKENGYFWHSTGSGKTLTSFLLTRSIAQETKFAKTVMLLDRNDLADQTLEEFRKFDRHLVKVVAKSTALRKEMENETSPIILTTIQSFNKLLNRKAYEQGSDMDIAFIIDEAHRSTFGKMFRTIKETFPNAQFIGFTGTPIFAENCHESERTTEDTFGKPVHVYTTRNAIEDGNVLPFELHEVQIKSGDAPVFDRNYYRDSARMNEVAKYVEKQLHKHTAQRNAVKIADQTYGFNAMLATDGISSAVTYWELLRPALKKQNRTTVTLFSPPNTKEEFADEPSKIEQLYDVMKAYDEDFGTSFHSHLYDSISDVHKEYARDVVRRIRSQEIDLIIVSDMLLTGFDAPYLNTIYLDKNLENQRLLQAMSRTNRTKAEANKDAGNIVLFSDREMSHKVDEAILLYSNDSNVEGVVHRRDYHELYGQLLLAIHGLHTLYPTAYDLDSIQDVPSLALAAQLVSSVSQAASKIQTYDEWDANNWTQLNTSEDEINDYYSILLATRARISGSEYADTGTDEEWYQLEFCIDGVARRTIDSAYINNLMMNGAYAPKEEKGAWKEKLIRSINQSTDPEVQEQKEAFMIVLDDFDSITNETELWAKTEAARDTINRNRNIQCAAEFGLTEEQLVKLARLYRSQELFPTKEAVTILSDQGLSIKQRQPLMKKLEETLPNIII